MSDSSHGRNGIVARIRLWLRGEVVDDVPPELAACEFQCRVHECLHDKWESCENRLRAARDAE
jgi:hypothetical protein